MRLLWPFFAALACLLPLGYVAEQWHAESTRAKAQLEAWQQEQELAAGLDKRVEILLGQVPLRTWLDEFTKQSGVPVVLHGREDQRSPDVQVRLDISGEPASSAIDALARATGQNWTIERDGSVGLYAYPDFPAPYLRTYTLPPRFRPELQREIAAVVQSTVAPHSWRRADGQAALIAAPNQLIILQRAQVHRRLRPFLDSLQTQLAEAAAIDPFGIAPDDARLKPVALVAPVSENAELKAKLDGEIALNVVNLPLKDALTEIGKQLHVGVHFSEQLAAAGVKLDNLVTIKRSDFSLSFLDFYLQQQGADFIPLADENAICIVRAGHKQHDAQGGTRAFPIPDFNQTSAEARELVNAIKWAIERDSWDDAGGTWSCRLLGDLLLVQQSERNLPRVAAMLTALRTVRSGRERWATLDPVAPGLPRSRHILERPLDLQYADTPFDEVVRDISRRTGITIRLTSSAELREALNDLPVTCNFPPWALGQNLQALLRQRSLAYRVDEARSDSSFTTIEITTLGEARPHDHLEADVIDIRALLANQQFTSAELRQFLSAAVEPDAWVNVGGPGAMYEFQGLLIVRQRAELLEQTRHVLAALEQQVPLNSAAKSRQNLLSRHPADAHPRAPFIHLYAVEDLLAPRGKFSPAELIDALYLSTKERQGPTDRPHAQVLANCFLVVYVRERDIAALEDNLEQIRERSRR